jgi:hypothetical protein
MKVSECIVRLQKILERQGDIQCESDCPFCNRSFVVGVVATAPETVRLNSQSIDGPVGTREVKG